jgi:hypothetical protein
MTTGPTAARRVQHPANPYVLASRPLRPGARQAATSRFGDDIWDLTPALLQRHKNALILNFPTLPARFRQAAKDLCYALLAGDLPSGERESSPDTIRVYSPRSSSSSPGPMSAASRHCGLSPRPTWTHTTIMCWPRAGQ